MRASGSCGKAVVGGGGIFGWKQVFVGERDIPDVSKSVIFLPFEDSQVRFPPSFIGV